ncbi:hypothetical protein [Leptothermofonsia sp. ETS-13]|uniref:hypothetical protein n=1 Tax=Leptothermofonsia sp. ETS-13 TaxID=3035696 RepID=UPI003B9E9129
MFLFAGGILLFPPLENQVAVAQRVRPDGVWQTIYEKLPELPLENQYISKETKQPATDNTLVGRLIRYHIYVKGRPPFFRLDWKVTLADYLGVTGAMDPSTYPSANTLRTNPLEGDIAAIRRLSRQQRDALVQALVDAFASQSTSTLQPGSAPTPSNP